MSTGVEYSMEPSRISGALYQSVTTSCVYGRIGIVNILASPKSHILTLSVLLFGLGSLSFKGFIRRFYGFRSLWRILLAWIAAIPSKSWYIYLYKYEVNIIGVAKQLLWKENRGRCRRVRTQDAFLNRNLNIRRQGIILSCPK